MYPHSFFFPRLPLPNLMEDLNLSGNSDNVRILQFLVGLSGT